MWERARLEIRKALAAACHYSGVNAALRRSIYPRFRILTYHRIINPESELFPIQAGMYVRPDTFAMQMKFLRSNANVLPLAELTDAITRKQTLPENTVAITFDDGWLDNYTNALPVLRSLQLPATIFLATAFVGSTEYFWTDRLAQTMTALAGNAQYRDQILSRLNSGLPAAVEARAAIQSLLISGAVSQEKLDNIIEHLKRRPLSERKQVIDLLVLLTKEFSTLKSARLFMNWNEVSELSKERISFGSHSHRHHQLTDLNEAQLKDELVESYQALKAHDIPAVDAFCYPGGYHSELTQRALRGENIRYALGVERHSDFETEPPILGRVHLHEDITSTVSLFESRLWGPAIF